MIIIFLFLLSRFPFFIDVFIFNQHNVTLFDSLCRLDCLEYMKIATNGYTHISASLIDMQHQQTNWAFFPLFPYTLKLLITTFKNPIIGIFFNQMMMLGSMYLLYQYTAKNYSQKIAFRTTVVLAFSSINIYMASLYTEAVFMFLTLCSINLIDSKKFFGATFFNGLLSATRVQGAVMLLPLIYNAYAQQKDIWKKKNFLKLGIFSIGSLSGLILFMVFLHYWVGDYLAFYHIQAAWGKNHDTWMHPVRVLSHWKSGKTLDLIAFLVFAPGCIFYFFKQKRWNEFFFIMSVFLISLFSQSSQSFFRFITACYPFYIAVSSSQKYFKYVLICMICLNGNFIYNWLANLNIYS